MALSALPERRKEPCECCNHEQSNCHTTKPNEQKTATPKNHPPNNEDQASSSAAASGSKTPQDHLTPTPSEERMDMELLFVSFEKLDLDGILDETIEGTSGMLGDLEDTLVQTREHEDELLEKITQKGKRWKASLIIIIQSQSS